GNIVHEIRTPQRKRAILRAERKERANCPDFRCRIAGGIRHKHLRQVWPELTGENAADLKLGLRALRLAVSDGATRNKPPRLLLNVFQFKEPKQRVQRLGFALRACIVKEYGSERDPAPVRGKLVRRLDHLWVLRSLLPDLS